MMRLYAFSASLAEDSPLLTATSRMMVMMPPGLFCRGQRVHEKHCEQSHTESLSNS